MIESNTICVRCGSPGKCGSLKHPFCLKCFDDVFMGDYEAYLIYLRREHIP